MCIVGAVVIVVCIALGVASSVPSVVAISLATAAGGFMLVGAFVASAVARRYMAAPHQAARLSREHAFTVFAAQETAVVVLLAFGVSVGQVAFDLMALVSQVALLAWFVSVRARSAKGR